MHNLARFSCLLIGTLTSLVVFAQESPAPADANTPVKKSSPDAVRSWIQDLSAKEFVQRENATLKLIDAGSPVIHELIKKLPTSNPEATARIIHILRQLALADDSAHSDPALEALQEVARQEGTAAGRRATSTLAKLSALREQRAIRAITERGGKITQASMQLGLQIVLQRVIHIGPEWTGTAEDLRLLKWISSAEAVIFEGDQVKDNWMPHLTAMQQLRSLTLKRATVTDAGITGIDQLKNLISLDIKYVPITDRSLEILGKMSQLRYIKLYGTKITKDAANKLQVVLAAAEVDHRNGAFLGVGCPQPPEPCIITSIQPGTAAQKAGLRTGDWIVSFSGKPVRDFNDLKKLIGQWRPGDKTTVQAMRINSPKFGSLRKGDDAKTDLAIDPHPLGLKITKLEEASPWYKAGLRAGDVIHKIGGERVLDRDAIQKEIASAEAGTLLQIIYYRKPQLQKYDIELGAWD